eukprot:m.61995 g.61995  ORF g.61995 m.61995 type:complete len:73 (-) comp19323_c0_seq1:92-310(-)
MISLKSSETGHKKASGSTSGTSTGFLDLRALVDSFFLGVCSKSSSIFRRLGTRPDARRLGVPSRIQTTRYLK